MMYVFGFCLLIVAGAVVVMFAMLGELYARGGGGSDERAGQFVRLLPEAKLGTVPTRWPPSLARLGSAPHAVLVVLSTACGSCEAVAAQLAGGEIPAEYAEFAVILSTGDSIKADEFLGRHDLGRLTCHVDMEGAWVTAEFGIATSPSALIFRDGRLTTALVFSDVAALRSAVPTEKEQV